MKSRTINLPYYFNKDFVVCKFPQILGASLGGRGRLNDMVAFQAHGNKFCSKVFERSCEGGGGDII